MGYGLTHVMNPQEMTAYQQTKAQQSRLAYSIRHVADGEMWLGFISNLNFIIT